MDFLTPMTQYLFQPRQQKNYQHYIVVNNVFNEEETNEIVSHGLSIAPEESRVSPNQKVQSSKSRNSFIRWLYYDNTIGWLYDRMAELVLDTNDKYYQFDLLGFNEPFQFTEYNEGQHYGWHVDMDAGILSNRKLSVVVQLNNPENFQGGNLQLKIGNKAREMHLPLGTAVLFPSYILHCVTPITAGTRHSLVSWVSGPAFR